MNRNLILWTSILAGPIVWLISFSDEFRTVRRACIWHAGADKILYEGCGSCHVIPGISGAAGRVGPPLSGIAGCIYIAGVIQSR